MNTVHKTEFPIEERNSCEISINAKGKWSGKVKAYGITVDDSFRKAMKIAIKLESLIGVKNE